MAASYSIPTVSRALSAKNMYMDNREIMRLKEQKENNDELDCPILFTPVTTEAVASKDVLSVAKFGQNNTMVGMNFISTAALTEWFKTRQTHPLTNQPLGINPLKKRAEYATHWNRMNALQSMEDGEPYDLSPEQVQEFFMIFLQDPTSFPQKYPLPYAWMQCYLMMGDTGLKTTFQGAPSEQRDLAMAFLANKPVGTCLFRDSSIQSTKTVGCFALSYVFAQRRTGRLPNDELVVIEATKIRNILIGHVMGYGYCIFEASPGDTLPEIDEKGVSNGASLPKHDMVWPSLLDCLIYLHGNRIQNKIDLTRLVLNVSAE